MKTPSAVIALFASMLGLGACDKTPSRPPAPIVEPVQVDSGTAAGPAGSTSVPSADSVFAPASAPKADAAAGRSNSALSAAQQSTAMPMPGQNNDHSAPLGPAKRASAP